jgi:hypothetical protein
LNKPAVIGMILLLSVIPLGQLSISNYLQFTAYQKQAELEEIQCANTPCFGEGMRASVTQEYFDKSMLYLLAAFMIGGVGMVAVGLNREELFRTTNTDRYPSTA